MDRLGFDGVGLNEHHTTPHGLMNSPNMMAAAAAQRTKKLKFLILGNLLPIHNPLRIAEELAMADCLSHGRILSGFARGVPREYNVYNVPMAESRARFEEAVDIILQGLDRADVLARGQVLAVSRTSRSGRGPTSSRIRRCGCRSPAPRRRSSGPAGTTSPPCCPTSSAA